MKLFKEFDPLDKLYCSIAAAILGGAALSAGASMWGSSNAAEAQQEAAQANINEARATREDNKAIMAPFMEYGRQAMPWMQQWADPNSTTNPFSQLIRLVTPGSDMTSTLEQLPGFQFAQSTGNKAVLNQLARRGLGGSAGAVAKGVANYNTGLANQYWGNFVDKLSGVVGSGANMFSSMVGTGTNAASAITGNNNTVMNTIAGANTGIGNAGAAQYNAMGSAVGQFGNSLLPAYMGNQLTGGSSIYSPTAGINFPGIYSFGYAPQGS